MKTTNDTPVLARVRALALPVVSDLGLEIYDLEMRGGTLRLTLDTPAGSETGVLLDSLSLASRLLAKELDAHDPIPSRYTLEVSSPGVERSLRTAEHFQREVGKEVALRLSDVTADDRRLRGVIVSADDNGVTLHNSDGDYTVAYHQIDRAKTVFEWGPAPKPGKGSGTRRDSAAATTDADTEPTPEPTESETTP